MWEKGNQLRASLVVGVGSAAVRGPTKERSWGAEKAKEEKIK